MGSLSGGRLKPNSIDKRTKAAILQADRTQDKVKCPEKGGKRPRRRKRDMSSASKSHEHGLKAEQPDVESEASRRFRISQMEFGEAVKANDVNYELGQINRVKRIPGLDRILIDQAFEERKANMEAV